MKKILIATNNSGKFEEIAILLKALDIQAVSPSYLNLVEPEEDALNFADNAFIKAKFYGDKAQMIALADDSGLCVVDLDNAPSIHSARFAIDSQGNKNFNWAFEKIFHQLAQKSILPIHQPEAYFVCNLCLYNPLNNLRINFEGRVDGYLTYPPLGNKGFGYDPIFIKHGMGETFGQIDPKIKHQISHRAQAFLQLENWLKGNYNIFDSSN